MIFSHSLFGVWLTHKTSSQALEDDVIPIAEPMQTASGACVDRIVIAKGPSVTIPIHCELCHHPLSFVIVIRELM